MHTFFEFVREFLLLTLNIRVLRTSSQDPPVTSKMESFLTIVNGQKPFTTVGKFSILDVCRGPAYVRLFCVGMALTFAP